MPYFSNRITPNHSTRIPRRHICMQVQPRTVEQRSDDKYRVSTLLCWHGNTIYRRQGKTTYSASGKGDTVDSAWSWLTDNCDWHHPTWIWSHGGLQAFTLLQGWTMLDSGNLDVKFATYNNRPWIMIADLDGRRIVWVDTLNFWDCPVEALANETECSFPRPGIWDNGIASHRSFASFASLAIRDGVSNLINYVLANNHGMMRTTISGQAFASWRHTHKGRWPEPHGIAEISDMERDAYCGGRVQIKYRGSVRAADPHFAKAARERYTLGDCLHGEQAYVYDFCSMYPSVMCGRKFPYKINRVLDDATIRDCETFAKNHAIIAKVSVNSKRREYPYCVKGHKDWAIGDFTTTLCTPELMQAISDGVVKTVHRVLQYDTADLFSEWVERHWQRRCEYEKVKGNPFTALEKKLGNSLYGYFGRRSQEWEDCTKPNTDKRWGNCLIINADDSVSQIRLINGQAQRKSKRGEWHKSIVSIPAHVTSHCRVKMSSIIDALPKQTLLYSDTDSLHVTRLGHYALRDMGYTEGREFGKLRLQYGPADADYLGRRVYRFGDRWVIAGPSDDRTWIDVCNLQYVTSEGVSTIIQGPMNGSVHEVIRTANYDPNNSERPNTPSGWLKSLHISHISDIAE